MKLKRNDDCSCGSGKKYKKCCYHTDISQSSTFSLKVNHYIELAESYYKQGDLVNAAHLGKEILVHQPKNHRALFLCGLIMYDTGQYDVAANLLTNAITQNPKNALYYKYLSIVYNKLSKLSLSHTCITEAIKCSPNDSDLYNILSYNCILRGDNIGAKYALLKAIELNPDELQFYLNLAVCLSSSQLPNELKDLYEKLIQKNATTVMRIPFMAIVIPVIVETYEDLTLMREWVQKEVDLLLNTTLENSYANNITLLRGMLKNPLFHLAYHGFNDKELVSKFNVLYKKNMQYFNYVAPHVMKISQSKSLKKIKVGFLSHYFWEHSVGKCFNVLIKKLGDLDDLEIIVFTEKRKKDSALQNLIEGKILYRELPSNHEYAIKIVAEEELDILIYTDIGMNEETYALAMARLAPIQCCLSGHPVTTGLSTIDYYISSRNFEPVNAKEHYSETLILLDNLPALIARPELPEFETDLSFLNLPDGTYYVCPMTLYKIHPEFDEIMANILQADPNGIIILFDDAKLKHFAKILCRRFAKTMPESYQRVIFIPWLNRDQFKQMLLKAHVILDPIHFGGGTTSYFMLGLGIPVITLPMESLRSRVTYSCYKLMNIEDMIAHDKVHYAEIAVKIANNKELYDRLSKLIMERNDVLFNNEKELVKEMHELMHDLISGNLQKYLTIVN
ncbi:putative O-linked N-acetylglucosamine transferase, SPINDLY family [Rickettsiales bacterium Ac37b]|nr:putative O-linked N-acetylglucosamine transferase, SPINDLY family [Rickettsiales bacterium Ac37b]